MTPDSQRTETPYKWWQIFLPDRGGWFFAYLLFMMLFLRPELLLWDGGTCRHIINGQLILQTHQIPSDNFTSWANPNIEVITRAWLSDLISGAFYQAAHLTGVVFICGLVIALGLTWSYQMGRARGFGLGSGLIMLILLMATNGMHWSARSHIYSYLPFLLLYYLVFMSRTSIVPRALAVVATMCIWSNAHGSFTIGLGMIVLKVIADAISMFRSADKTESAAQLRTDAAALAAGLVGTCINPRGLQTFAEVTRYLFNSTVHRTDEWKSLFDGFFSGIGAPFFVIFAVVVGLLIWKTKTSASRVELALLILLAMAGVKSMRMIPYCALVAMPIAVPAWRALRLKLEGETIDPEAKQPWYRKWLRKLVSFEVKAESQEKSSLALSLGATAVALVMGVVAMTVLYFQVKEFDPDRLPVAAVNLMTDKHIFDRGHGFNYDNWGGYIYFKTHQRVFIDDWTDFLPDAFIDDYLRVLLAQTDWQNTVNSYDFQWVLTQPEANIAQVLSRSPEWEKLYEDKTSILLVKRK